MVNPKDLLCAFTLVLIACGHIDDHPAALEVRCGFPDELPVGQVVGRPDDTPLQPVVQGPLGRCDGYLRTH